MVLLSVASTSMHEVVFYNEIVRPAFVAWSQLCIINVFILDSMR